MEDKDILQSLDLLLELRLEPRQEKDEKRISLWTKLKIETVVFFKFLFWMFHQGFGMAMSVIMLLAIAAVLAATPFSVIYKDNHSFTYTKGGIFICLMISFFLILQTIIFLLADESKNIRKEVIKKAEICLGCRDRKARKDFPYCSECFQRGIEKITMLEEETKGRIRKSLELGLEKQAEGAVNYFLENLPEPIKFLIEKERKIQAQQTLRELKKVFPQAKLFNPDENFEEYPINTNNPEVNIPLKGLKVLEKFRKLFGKKLIRIEKKGAKQIENKKEVG